VNKKFIGSSFEDALKAWEKKHPGLREAIEEHREKTIMGMLLKKAREKKAFSQAQLAKKANVPQSVVCRIESPASTVMPRIALYSKLARAMGYRLVLTLEEIPA
jgi:ribosome-binding protein aMBF1 (putative translation factor)